MPAASCGICKFPDDRCNDCRAIHGLGRYEPSADERREAAEQARYWGDGEPGSGGDEDAALDRQGGRGGVADPMRDAPEPSNWR